MKRLMLACSLIALAGCAVTNSQVQVGTASGGLAIDATYNAASTYYLSVAPTLPKATHDSVKALLGNAYACVQAADAAAAIGDSSTLGAQIAAATTLITQANSLLHPAGAQ